MRVFTLLLMALSLSCATTPNAQPFDGQGASPEAQGYTHYLAGVYYQRNGRAEEAAKEFRKASDLLPESPTLNIRLVQFYIDVQDYANAEVICRRVLEQVPDDASLWIILATLYQQQDKHEEAASALEKAMQLRPQSLQDYEGLLRVGGLSHDWITMIDVLQKLSEMAPDSPHVHLQLGKILRRTANGAEAQAALERALELDSSLMDARFDLGIVYLDENEDEAAAEQFQQYLEQVPDEDDARELLAGALARMGNYADALVQIQKILERGEPNPINHLENTYLLIRAGRLEEAADAVPANETPLLGTVFRALARKAAGQAHAPLIESLDQAEGDVDAECSDLLNGMLYLFGNDDMGDYFVDALSALRASSPQSRTLSLILARTLMSLERNEEAATLLESILQKDEPDKWVHFYLGTVYETLDRFDDSEKHLRACIDMDPMDSEAMNNLAYMFAEEDKKLEEAEKLLKKALEIAPQNGYYLDSLGWVYFRKGNAELAIEHIRRAILTMERDDAVLRDHLGDAYLLKGDVSKAVGEWSRARRLDPELEGVQEKIDAHAPTSTAP